MVEPNASSSRLSRLPDASALSSLRAAPTAAAAKARAKIGAVLRGIGISGLSEAGTRAERASGARVPGRRVCKPYMRQQKGYSDGLDMCRT